MAVYPSASTYPGTTTYPDNTPLTPLVDFAPVPRVLVSISTLATGTQTVNVLRTSEGREMEVRGGIALYAVGGASVMDYEAPPGVSSYRAQQFDVNGAPLGYLDLGQVTMPDFTCIHQPLSPVLAVESPRILLDSANDIAHPSPGQVVWPEGATVGRIIGGQRRGLVGARLHVRLNSQAQAATFASMFGGYMQDFPSVLCVRTPAGKLPQLPRVLFAGCLDPHEIIYGANALLTYDMTVDEVAPPYPGLILPLLRRDDLDAAYATRDEMDAAYATRLQMDTDYSKAGLAG